MSFPAQVLRTIPAPVRELGSGPPFSGGRRARRAVLRRRRAGLAVAVRARAAAGGGTAPRRDRLARQGAVLAAAVRDRSGQAGGGAGRGEGDSPRGAEGAVAARRGRAAEAAAGGSGHGFAQAEHDRLAAPGGRGPASPYRGARGGVGEGSRDEGGACQGAVRAQERAPGTGGVGPSARPTGRRRRPWSHAQAGSRKTRGSSQPRGGRARLLRLRETVCGERLRHVGTDRGVRQGAHARDRAPALAPKLRLRRRAAGSLGAAGGAPVREHGLRDQRVGAVPVRALCVSSAPQPGRRLADRPGAGDLGGDAGRRRAAPRAAVRAALGGHSRAPERGAVAPGRRDGLAHPGARRGRRVAPRVAVDRGLRGRGLLPCRPLARRRGGGEAVRRRRPGHGPGVRPVQRLQETGQGLGGACDTRVLLGPRETGFHQVRGPATRRWRTGSGAGSGASRGFTG